MKNNGDQTMNTYNYKAFVNHYSDYNQIHERGQKQLKEFLSLVSEGERILDLGCGPGWYAIAMADKGFWATGLDYSAEMIEEAKKNEGENHKVKWIVGDMLELEDLFEENSFEAVWARASLLHINKKDIGRVLTGIRRTCMEGGAVMISLKQGNGVVRVKDEKFGLETEREFVLWEKDEFVEVAAKYGLDLKSYDSFESSSIILGKSTKWHWMMFEVEK